MDATRPDLIMQRLNVVQHELVPMLIDEMGALTPKLEKVIYQGIGPCPPTSAISGRNAQGNPHRLRSRHEVQRPGLQGELERLQVAPGYR